MSDPAKDANEKRLQDTEYVVRRIHETGGDPRANVWDSDTVSWLLFLVRNLQAEVAQAKDSERVAIRTSFENAKLHMQVMGARRGCGAPSGIRARRRRGTRASLSAQENTKERRVADDLLPWVTEFPEEAAFYIVRCAEDLRKVIHAFSTLCAALTEKGEGG